MGFPWGHSLCWAHPSILTWSPPRAAGAQSGSPWSSPQPAGEVLFSTTWIPSFPSSLTDLSVWRAVSLIPLLWLQLCSFFPPFLDVIPEALRPLLMDSALSCSWMALALSDMVGSFWHSLTKATHVVPPIPKSCHTEPMQHNNLQACSFSLVIIAFNYNKHCVLGHGSVSSSRRITSSCFSF